jgi:hypothetical protein
MDQSRHFIWKCRYEATYDKVRLFRSREVWNPRKHFGMLMICREPL